MSLSLYLDDAMVADWQLLCRGDIAGLEVRLVAQLPLWLVSLRRLAMEGSDPELVGFGGQHVRASDRQSSKHNDEPRRG